MEWGVWRENSFSLFYNTGTLGHSVTFLSNRFRTNKTEPFFAQFVTK